MIIVSPLVQLGENQDAKACVLGEKIALHNYMQQRGLSLSIGPTALLWTAEEVRKLPADPGPDDAASAHARSIAEQLLTGCTSLTPSAISPISIEQFEHDLLMRWQFNGKGLIITCPATDSKGPSIYREHIEDGRATWTEMLHNASAGDLAHSMQWMLVAES